MKKGFKTAIIVFLSLAIIFILSAVAFVLNETKKSSDKIFEGVYVNDLHLGGKLKKKQEKSLRKNLIKNLKTEK